MYLEGTPENPPVGNEGACADGLTEQLANQTLEDGVDEEDGAEGGDATNPVGSKKKKKKKKKSKGRLIIWNNPYTNKQMFIC